MNVNLDNLEYLKTKTFNEVCNFFKDDPDGVLPKGKTARAKEFVDFIMRNLKTLSEKEKSIKAA